ncbi:sensor histidine kinase [Rhodohalobacter sp. 614A]|uniref:sensor histidine kinase n=1 Tax=Rhodohalobacter sp. 614A TaxID=2908649 RepID=UPI001F3FDE03|nr:PAS domain S-box protein [Rhodohalobacter sp. 614A]
MHSFDEIVVSKPEEIEKRLRLLHKIVSQKSHNLDDHLFRALKMTTQLLGMEVGILSSISGDTYTVINHYSKNSGLENGQTFNLGETYCSITIEKNKVVAINEMQLSEHRKHPCYEVFKLESYIGIPIYIDDQLYGTINFSSPDPKKPGFLEADKTLVKLLAEWTASVIRRKSIEESYKESEKLYKLISTNSADLICLHDPDGKFRFVSPSSEYLLGYKPAELLGKNPYEFHHPEDIERVKEQSHNQALENNLITSIQYRFKKKNGEYIWLDTATQPIKNDKGEVINLQTTSRDITARKKLEILFSEAQQMANVGGWEFDIKSGKLTWTDEVYRIHEKPVGEKVFVEEGLSYYPSDARTKIEEAIEYTMETGKKYDVALPFVTAKGNHKWVRAIGQALFLEKKPYKLRGTFQDITKYKEYEQKIKDQNTRLKEVTETRDKLYSIIGHDLKNTFFGLFGLISMMKENTETNEQSFDELIEHFDLLQTSTKQAYQLLENLLEWIKMQQHNVSFIPREANIAELIQESIDVQVVVAQNKNISIETSLSECPPVSCDPEMIKTCMRNLISNAVKFSPFNSSIQVSAFPTESNITVSVKDSGIGMPEKVRQSLFDPANRPKRQGTDSERGTGLGLLLCKEFVDLHGGTIEVNSTEGKGSEFVFTIPFQNKL